MRFTSGAIFFLGSIFLGIILGLYFLMADEFDFHPEQKAQEVPSYLYFDEAPAMEYQDSFGRWQKYKFSKEDKHWRVSLKRKNG